MKANMLNAIHISINNKYNSEHVPWVEFKLSFCKSQKNFIIEWRKWDQYRAF